MVPHRILIDLAVLRHDTRDASIRQRLRLRRIFTDVHSAAVFWIPPPK